MTIQEMKQRIANGEVTIAQLIQDTLDLIKEYSHLNAVIEINPDALEIAKKLDKLPQQGALHGIPILIKDNVSTADKMKTSTGSVALADNIAVKDAPIVTRLREAGAVIIGKANLTEFSNYMTDAGMPNGYSSRGGQTISTFGDQIDTSGSSSGSAVAVAAGIVPATIGTETCGSIVSPAKNAGILGLKPTKGRVPSAGIIPISETLDVAGPMARSADDLQVVFEVISNQKIELPETLEGMRVGIVRELAPAESANIEANEKLEEAIKKLALEAQKNTPYYEKIINQLKSIGANIVELSPHGIHSSSLYPLIFHEFKPTLNSYLVEYSNTQQNTLAKIIKYNQEHADIALKYGQNLLVQAEETIGDLSEVAYQEALVQQKKATIQFAEFFETNKVDVIFSFVFDLEASCFAGNPTLTMPIEGAKSNESPLGAFFIGKHNDEATLIKLAKELTNKSKTL